MSQHIQLTFLIALFFGLSILSSQAAESNSIFNSNCDGLSITATSSGVSVTGPSIQKIEYASHNGWQYQVYCNDCGTDNQITLSSGTYRIKVFRTDWSNCEQDITVSGGNTTGGNGNNGNGNGNNGNGNGNNGNGNGNNGNGNGNNGNGNGNNGNGNGNNGNGSNSFCENLTIAPDIGAIEVVGASIRSIEYANHRVWQYQSFCNNNCGTNNFIPLEIGTYRVKVFRNDWSACEQDITVEGDLPPTGGNCSAIAVSGGLREIVITDQRIPEPFIRLAQLEFSGVEYFNNATGVGGIAPECFRSTCSPTLTIPVEFARGNNRFTVTVHFLNGPSCQYVVDVVEIEDCVCGAVVDPVCGVDGQTYNNACEAECAGVAIAYRGTCNSDNIKETIRVCTGSAVFLEAPQSVGGTPASAAELIAPPSSANSCFEPQTPSLIAISPSDNAVQSGTAGFTITPTSSGIYTVRSQTSCCTDEPGNFEPPVGPVGCRRPTSFVSSYQYQIIIDCDNNNCTYLENFTPDPCNPAVIETSLYSYRGRNYIVTEPDPSLQDAGREVVDCETGAVFCAESPFPEIPGCGNFFNEATKIRVISSREDCQTTACAYLENFTPNPCDPNVIEISLYSYRGLNYVVKIPDPTISDTFLEVMDCRTGSFFCVETSTGGCGIFINEAEKIRVISSRDDCPPTGSSECDGINFAMNGGTLRITGTDIRAIQFANHKDWQYQNACDNFNCGNPKDFTLYGPHQIKIFRTDWTVCERTINFPPDPRGNVSGAAAGRSSDFTQFNAFQAARSVDLEWVTNNTYRSTSFIVEKSINGVDFEVLAEIDAEEASEEVLYFNEIDEQPILGANHYRLKQLFTNNTFEYSEVRTIDFGINLKVLDIFPNPTTNELFINLQAFKDQTGTLFISNQYGKIMEEIELATIEGEIRQIDVTKYENGLYFLRLRIGAKYIPTQKFIVSKLH